jgi:signal transduction histidine kinase
MATFVAPCDPSPSVRQGAPPRRYRRVPWSPGAWRQALCLTGGIPALLGGVLFPAIVAIDAWWQAGNFPPAPPSSVWALAFLTWLPLLYLILPVLTWLHRQRLRAVAGIEIARQPRIPGRLTRRGIVAAARSEATWRQLGYHALAAPLLAMASAVAACCWVGGPMLVVAWALRSGPFLLVHGGVLVAVAAVGLMVAPWLTSGVAVLDGWAALALLEPSRAEELEHRVEHLTETRAGVVDAADAERRRLERDLHDGTQQRLVSLAMNLGMARVQASTTGEARQAIAEAHEEAKAALSELRDLIRGLHPAVLEDRGLDAALSGIAARMPIPVRLTVDLPRRPAPVIEAVAYFVVSEGLANIAKHAQASQAEVFVQRAGDRLHIIVSDDGVGGADPARGTGLAGLARRAESVDGTLEVASPAGGPTLLSVDLPCAR